MAMEMHADCEAEHQFALFDVFRVRRILNYDRVRFCTVFSLSVCGRKAIKKENVSPEQNILITKWYKKKAQRNVELTAHMRASRTIYSEVPPRRHIIY